MNNEEIIKGLQATKEEIGKHLNESFAWTAEFIDEAIEALEAEPCEDYVSRQAAIKAFEELPHEYKTKEQRARTGGIAACQIIVRELPSVTLKQKTGKWIKEESICGWDGKSYQCSACGRSIHLDTKVEDLRDYPYCHCGTKMEGESE